MDRNRQSPKRPDRRRERTRRQLSEALIALIIEQGYDDIRVEDIADHADLGRATFYLHFGSKDDLLLHTLKVVFEVLIDEIKALPLEPLTVDNPSAALIAFRHAEENRNLYRAMLKSERMGPVLERLRPYLASRVRDQIELLITRHHVTSDPLPMDVIANYVATSLLGMITWWLSDESGYSAEEMAAMFARMTRASIAAALGMQLS